jgi:hypothetical protein
MKCILGSLIVLFLVFVACSNDGDDNTPVVNTVSYVYRTDTSGCAAFRALFTAYKYKFNDFTLAQAETADFSGSTAIIIGSDVYYNTSFWAGSVLARTNIDDAGKLIIGCGRGGYAFFGRNGGLSLAIGYGNGMGGSQPWVEVADQNYAVWLTPNPVTITNLKVDLYVSAGTGVFIFNENLPASGSRVYALSVPAYSAIVAQVTNGHRYILWGFNDSPDDMTTDGKNLFINLLTQNGL